MYNVTIQDLMLIILTLSMLYVLFRSNPCSENFDTTNDLTKLYDPIKNLGNIASSLMNNNGSLIIPANNTTMSGNLNVDGNLIVKGNANKLILITIPGYKGYSNGPLLDSNGFTIPADKYYYRINTDRLLLVINENTRDWWCQDNTDNTASRINPIIIEFVPRSDYNSNTIFDEKIINFNNIQEYGYYMDINSKKTTSINKNTTDINPYK